MTPTIILPLGALVTMTLLGILDHKSGRMPNVITLGSWGVALNVQGMMGQSSAFVLALIASFIVALPPLLLFLISKGEGIGGGDVKAMLALGAWLGPLLGLQTLLLALVLLAGVAYYREARFGRLGPLLLRSLALFVPGRKRLALSVADGRSSLCDSATVRSRISLRFGPYLALATWASCVATWIQGPLPAGVL